MGTSRLVLSRYLYDKALSTWESGESFSMGLAVSLAQDAVESMLNELALRFEIAIPSRATFYNLVEKVRGCQRLPKPLPYFKDIQALNDCRVGFKHHGNIPDEQTARRHIDHAGYFLAAVCRDMLETDWDRISLADAVQEPDIRGRIKAAEHALASDDFDGCREQCSLAHHEIEIRVARVLPRIPEFLNFHRGDPQDQVIEAMLGLANALSEEVAIVSLRLNRMDVARFEALIPRPQVSPFGGSVQFVDRQRRDVSHEDMRFCLRHVTQAALRYQERYGSIGSP